MEKDVLNRILWDKRLNPADFDIYYLDRITKKLGCVKFTDIKFEGDFFRVGETFIRNSKEFRSYEFPKETHIIPLHRIRRITCRGEVVWSRER